MSDQLKFTPAKSFVDASFFQRLSTLKLDEFKLDSTKKPIVAFYNVKSISNSDDTALNLSSNSFDEINEDLYPYKSVSFLQGDITNVNTIESFKNVDKAQFLKDAGNELLENIKSQKILDDPSLLNRFQLLSFADLKKFKFYYWLAFPTLYSKWDIVSRENINVLPKSVDEWFKNSELQQSNHFLYQDDVVQPLSDLRSNETGRISVGFVDSTLTPDKPSKFLHNFLTALALYGFKEIDVHIFRFPGKSFKLSLSLSEVDPTKVAGWERTIQGKLGPKLADLGSLIDPVKLSEQSVDLNLKLMKWRIAPDLNLDIIKETKVLLLGSGTLGSYVSRALLGWGVRTISFVDNGKVSFSNPVRQSLFNFEDVGQSKAKKAAESLKKIFPLVNAEGYELEIPMAGHPVTNNERQQKDFETLEKLIDEHDVIFLLTDSRETRWLPTVIGNSKKKIVINAALGFDSYLVMRHGVEGNLGCYFCNDVVAPTDSLTDRTLDQMCTVTRPGIALLAASLGVELLTSLLQHPQKHYASTKETSILGDLPHQLRGFLGNHTTLKLEAPAYEYCSACSKSIVTAYEEGGWQFVSNALNDSGYLEKVSGLDEVQKKAEEAVAELEQELGSDDDW